MSGNITEAHIEWIQFKEQIGDIGITPPSGDIIIYNDAGDWKYKDEFGTIENITSSGTLNLAGAQVSGTTSVLSSTSLSVQNFAEVWDVGGYISSANSLTIPAGGEGLYHVDAYIQFDVNFNGDRSAIVFLQDSFEVIGSTMKATSGAQTEIQCSAMYPFYDGDVITVKVFQDSGISLSTKTVLTLQKITSYPAGIPTGAGTGTA